MFDFAWSELLVIAVVLIVVVGPKDLPQMLRAFGKMTTRLRRTAGEFRSQFEEALRESELDEVARNLNDARGLNPSAALRDAMNPLRQIGADIKADLQKATHVGDFPRDEAASTPLDALSTSARPMSDADMPPAYKGETYGEVGYGARATTKPATEERASKAVMKRYQTKRKIQAYQARIRKR